MGGAASVLGPRGAAAAALVAALAGYYTVATRLPTAPLWLDVVVVSLVVAPAMFALAYLALPLRAARGLIAVGLGSLALAFGLESLELESVAAFAKFTGMTAIGFWFLGFFERLSWVVAVALVIPLVDTASVARGPTNEIVRDHPAVFDTLSVGFPMPGERTVTVRWDQPSGGDPRGYNVYVEGRERPLNGEELVRGRARGFSDWGRSTHGSLTYRVDAVGAGDAEVTARPGTGVDRGTASRDGPRNVRAVSERASMRLGLPDFLFFALFLAAAARWALRPRATWIALVASLGITIVLAIWLDPFGLGGLPALPGLSLAFIAANADLIWRDVRRPP